MGGSGSGGGGGGSAGAIYINTGLITGSGKIWAIGGTGGVGGGSYTCGTGAGGGGQGAAGRLIIIATSTSGFNINSPTITGSASGGDYRCTGGDCRTEGLGGSGGSVYGSYIFIQKNGGTGLDDIYVYRGGTLTLSSALNYHNINLYNSCGLISTSSTFTMSGSYGGDGTGSSTIQGLVSLGNNSTIASGTLNAIGTTTFGTNFTVGGGGGSAYYYQNASTTNGTNLTINSGGVFEYQTLSSTYAGYAHRSNYQLRRYFTA